jgi:membrane protein YqaA with SNARE-associated domain
MARTFKRRAKPGQATRNGVVTATPPTTVTGRAAGTPAWVRVTSGSPAGFAWGLFEGAFFFLVPDILLTLTALFSVRRSVRQLLTVLLGSLVAGACLFAWGKARPDQARAAILRVPFVSQRMFDATRKDYETSGVWALCRGPASGIPYKVYAVQAAAHTSLGPFLLVSIPARLERLLLSWALFAVVGRLLRKPVAAHPRQAIGAHAVYWIAIYAWYWYFAEL